MATLLQRVSIGRRVTKARDRDPWRRKLEGLRGELGNDGVERVTTASVLETLDLPPRTRSTQHKVRLAKLMKDLGWQRAIVRGVNGGGYREKLRGYVRCSENHSQAIA